VGGPLAPKYLYHKNSTIHKKNIKNKLMNNYSL